MTRRWDEGHEPWADALGAYLLGALPEQERRDFETHLESCDRCREEANSLRAAVDVLPAAVPPVEPPAELRGRIMQIVESEAELLRAAGSEADRPPAPRPRRGLRGLFPRPVVTAGAAAAALALGIAGGIVLTGGDDGGAGGARTLAARVTDPAARAAVVLRGQRATLVVEGMPAPERGRVWQVWLKPRNGSPVPAGATFEVRSGEVAIPKPVRRGQTLMVTSERDGGSLVPTRSPVIVAEPV